LIATMRRKWLINDVSERSGNRHRHRAGAAALALAAIAGVALVGCGGGGGSSTTGTAATSPGAATTTTPTQGTTTAAGGSSGNVFGGGGAAKGHTVADALNAVLTSGDPAKACGTDYVTEHYLTTAYGGKQGCVHAQSSGSAARSVDIQGLAGGSSEAGTASVKVVPKGGVYSGENLVVSLVKEGQDWKIDSLKSNAPVGP
jgi:hypothetical protein